MFTAGNIIFIICWVMVTIIVSIDFSIAGLRYSIINFLCSISVLALVCIGIVWHNNNTASGIRALKDIKSELNNGIEREIIITSEDGREIFHYEGKVDVELDHDDNYIKFLSEDGKMYIIYYGIRDTIKIIEK